MNKSNLQIKIINGIANDATEEQLEGLVELLFEGDIFYGLEKIIDKKDFQDGFNELKKEILEEQ